MELFLFARFHARPGLADAVRRAIREVEGPTRADAPMDVEIRGGGSTMG